MNRGAPLPAWVLAIAVSASACTADRSPTGSPADAPSVRAMAEDLGADVVERLARGYVPRRSGEIALVPKPWNVLGQWNDGLRGARDPRTTHASPWSYHQRVPIVLWGPGYITEGVRSRRSVDVGDLAPTLGRLLGSGFRGPESAPLHEALNEDRRRPRAIVLVAVDGGGWNVLSQWPDAWPTVRRLAGEGAVYTNATVGSAPSVTAPVHATMGTGAYPRTHGLAENTVRLPDGTMGEIYFHRADPELLAADTVADRWDRSRGNRPWVGMLGFESWHLGMMGAGARAPGGDRDVAVLWHREEFRYWTNEEYYRLPDYLPGDDALRRRLHQLDREDGAADGEWLGHTLDPEDTFRMPGTPAFVQYQADTVVEILRREPIGRDDVTDLLFVELKPLDYGGHIWNMVNPEIEDLLAATDRAVARLTGELDRVVGRGQYVMAITADHGQSPIPETRGGLRIDRFELERDIEEHFGAIFVDAVHPSEAYLDLDALREAGITVEEVARFIGDYRYRDGLPPGADLEGTPERLLDQRVFAGALPGSYLDSLSPAEIEALGPGVYPEGDLTSPPPVTNLLGE